MRFPYPTLNSQFALSKERASRALNLFSDEGILPGWESVLAALTEISPWGKLQFMLSGDLRLEGKTPLECLQIGETEKVVAAAKAYGQQVAA